LAEKICSSLLNETFKYLDSLNFSSLPTDVRTLRKGLLYVRTAIDVFVFAFPIESETEDNDTWFRIRTDLDKGYTLIGDFQDLSKMDVKYTKKELRDKRDLCLKWKLKFMENAIRYAYIRYLQRASSTVFYFRDVDELSELFWGGIPERPIEALTGFQNIALLEKGLFNESLIRYENITKIKNLYNEHTNFHEFRKLLRSVLSLIVQFPQIYKKSESLNFDKIVCTIKSTQKVLTDVVNQFGDINDILNTVDYYMKQNDEKKAIREIEKADRKWYELEIYILNMPFDKFF